MSTNNSVTLMAEMAVFVRVVDCGSFSAAARQLGATPSAVSRSVSRLEKALGTRLLQRTTRKLRLSESGQAVYLRCVDLVQAAQAVVDVTGQLSSEPQGVLRVSVPKAVGRFLIHPHIPDFLARYPKIDVHLRLDDRYVDLIDEQVDLAIRITDHPSPGLMGRRLTHIDHLLCATPEYLASYGEPTHPRDLTAHNCIFLGEEPGDSRWKFRRGNKRVSVDVNGRYAVNHTGARLDAVLRHLGIGSLPLFTASHALDQGKIVPLLPQWRFVTNYSGDAWILYPPTRHLPAKSSAFIRFMQERLSADSDADRPYKTESAREPAREPARGPGTASS
ncbi:MULTISPECIES: LysR family transcriptional regulator [unclassified Halomonas]|uniref:LysR family transcriptional regulator n=1 Tax=unclassified Halomonas TaxID=2609666 RepID=UPI001C981D28|nr:MULTISPECIES: LysR family transcriptional regulator [unclassified Halomonas]MBY5926433.1 LysR family transcriptional regulator [Halomonas sp. DP4Y7-2]MBY6233475.1 LysR family transcriptional regulator [Halomonas sp. DP4Y7-1]